MTKFEFLTELKNELHKLPKAEVDEIIRDQDEYITAAVSHGRTETQVVASLGNPKVFAQNLVAETHIESARSSESFSDKIANVTRATFAVIALAPLNLIFVLGPFLGLCGILVAGWVCAGAVFGTSMLGLLVFFKELIYIKVGMWAHLSTLFFTIGMAGLGTICFFLVVAVTKAFLNLSLSYLKWNLQFIRGRA